MANVSREKAALFVFIGLILAGLAALLVYIFVIGHSLNTTASKINDATGNLDGYTVLLYDGTAEKKHQAVVRNEEADPEDFGKRNIADALAKRDNNAAEDEDDEVNAAQAVGGDSDEQDEEASQKLTMLSLSRSYIAKKACAVVLDTKTRQAYGEVSIIRAGGKTYGIFNIDEISAQQTYFDKRVAQYKELNVDFIVCITQNLSLLSSYDGVDIVISQQDEGLAAGGAFDEGVFYDDAAFTGTIGSILVSPSRTITAKDVVSL